MSGLGTLAPSAKWVLSVGAMVLLSGTFELPLLDRDEPRFSRATVEMSERGDWIIPYFNGDYRFDKPPLTYWWMGIHHWLFGVNEFSSRLHAIISTLLVAGWMILRGRQWVGEEGAKWGALIWLLNLQIWQHGRLALADMPMILGVCLAMDGLWNSFYGEKSEQIKGPLFLWGGISLGFLAKGPIVLAIPLFVWIALLFTKKVSFAQTNQCRPVLGITVSLAVVGCWGIPALLMTEGAYGEEGIGKHVVERGVSSFNDRSYTPFFYLGTFFLSSFPWCLRLKSLASSFFPVRGLNERFYLLFWFLAPVLIFTFYSTQLPHYLLPGFPALFLLLGKSIGAESNHKKKSIPVIEIVFSILLVGVMMEGDHLVDENFPFPLVACLAVVLFSFLWMPWLCIKRKILPFVFALLLLCFSSFAAAKILRSQHLTLRIAKEVGVKPDQNIFRTSSFSEPSLVYYLGGPWKFEAQDSIAGNSNRKVRIEKEQPEDLANWKKISGFNPGRGKIEEVWVQSP